MKIKLLSLALIALVAFASCKKDDPTPVTPTPTPSQVGFWKGKYANGATAYPTSGYAFLYRAGGTVRVFNTADTTTSFKAEGTYVITGNTITCTYTYLPPGAGTYSTTAVIDAKFTFIEGIWGSGTNSTNGGNYFVNKQ